MARSYTLDDVHAEMKQKPHRTFLGFIVVVIAIITIISFQKNKLSELANNLQKPKNLLSVTAKSQDRPVKLTAYLYAPQDIHSKKDLTAKEVAERFDTIILPAHEIAYQGTNRFEEYKKAGMQGNLLYYFIPDALVGPSGLSLVTAQTQPCSASQKDFSAQTQLTATSGKGEFCEIHNSIISSTAQFDHDLDPNTPAINASEEWFFHKRNGDGSRGDRIIYMNADSKEVFYAVNPANFQVRQYIIAHLKKDIGTNFAGNGIFLDNIDLSLSHIRVQASLAANTDIFEFSSYAPAAGDSIYADSIFYLVNDMRGALNSYAQPLTLWGHFLGNSFNGFEWDRYNEVLTGGMMDGFAVEPGKLTPISGQQLENQLVQIQKWQDAGGKFIAHVNGAADEQTAVSRYSLAAALLVTNGQSTSYLYEVSGKPNAFVEYPEYYYALGKPVDVRQRTQVQPTLVKYVRNFECGTVELQLDETVQDAKKSSATITVDKTCTPGVSPTPSFTPSPTITPTLAPTNTPLPTATPLPTFTPAPTFTLVPTFTPIPTATPAPLVCGWCGSDCVPFDANRSCTMSLPPANFKCEAVTTNGRSSCQRVRK